MFRDSDTETGVCRPLHLRSWAVHAIVILLLLGYVGSYGYLSRHGFAMADEWGMHGFYFFLPENTSEWRCKETTLRILYLPLIYIDCWVGTGRWPASEPTWRLSWGQSNGHWGRKDGFRIDE